MATEQLTFNDVPEVLKSVLDKVERLENLLIHLQEQISTGTNKHQDAHIPMNLDEACEFLKMKKSTMYYHLEKGNIPATRSGKNYLLFKDELIKWAENGRKNQIPLTPEEENALRLNSMKRKPSKRY
ncbi:MAG: helix-turn-helix domain-containing protein [Massilibacteroides sp.]|jgi:excisionase family DNA binding protein|nr:helix-turn-helix domain-containing protein [Massilibacteroides sp.]